jgi:predicted metalloprotease with PDZ domain
VLDLRTTRSHAIAAVSTGLWLISFSALAADAGAATVPPPVTAGAAAAPACDIEAEVEPLLHRQPRVLAVTLRFDAGSRSETVLRPSSSWAGITDFGAAFGAFVPPPGGAIEALPGTPMRWRVRHGTQQRLAVSFEVRAALADPDDGRPQPQEQLYRPQLGADWFQFFGHGVLPSLEHWGDDRTAQLCVTLLQPGQPDAPALGSHHAGRGESVQARFTGSPGLLRHGFYAGGHGWRVLERPVAGGVMRAALRGRFAMADAAFADASAALVNSHRRFWGEHDQPVPWMVLTPNFHPSSTGGTLVHQAIAMHAGPDFSPGHPTFEFLVGHEHLHQWFPQRFGNVEPDPLRAVRGYWFSEGFTNYYTHRLLLASGLWDLPRYAANLTTNLQTYWRSPARDLPVDALAPRFFSDRDAGRQLYSRGEWLAMRWDRALRDLGHDGLDAVLRGLLEPAGPAGRETSHATERLLVALSARLDGLPRRDVQRYIETGAPVELDPEMAGPCLHLTWETQLRWVPGFDMASLAVRRAIGVRPDGPAHRAGLREGMTLRGWSVHRSDTQRDIELQWDSPDGGPGDTRTVRFRPVDGSVERLPVARVRADAGTSAACHAWLRS